MGEGEGDWFIEAPIEISELYTNKRFMNFASPVTTTINLGYNECCWVGTQIFGR
jgi:hypothetical protein